MVNTREGMTEVTGDMSEILVDLKIIARAYVHLFKKALEPDKVPGMICLAGKLFVDALIESGFGAEALDDDKSVFATIEKIDKEENGTDAST